MAFGKGSLIEWDKRMDWDSVAVSGMADMESMGVEEIIWAFVGIKQPQAWAIIIIIFGLNDRFTGFWEFESVIVIVF